MAKKKKGPYVVIATDKRGVFAGYLESHDKEAAEAVLVESRQCVYWSKGTGGFMGLAAKGPQDGSRVSEAAPRVTYPGVHCVAECSDEARAEWESGKWV